jgi:hypothetical protein
VTHQHCPPAQPYGALSLLHPIFAPFSTPFLNLLIEWSTPFLNFRIA